MMFRNYLRQATSAALALGATLLSGAAQAQVTYNYTFPQVPANIVATLSGSTAPVGGGPLYHPPLIRYNDDPAVSVLPATLLTSTIGQTLTPYRFTNFVVTSAGLYSVTLSGTLTDVTAAQAGIYQNSFDPANPLKNNVALIPGATTGTPRVIKVNLTPGNYVLVVNSVNNGASGTFTATVTQATAAIFNTTGSTVPSGAGPQFNRPTPNGNLPPVTAGYGSNYTYQADPFTVPTTGLYQLYSSQPGYQGQINLYQNSFDPANSLVNCLLVSGSSTLFGSPTGSSSLITTLTAGTQYVLVTNNLQNGVTQTHSYSNTVSPVTVPTLDSWAGTTVGGPAFNRPAQPAQSTNGVLPTALSGVRATYDAHTYNSTTDGIATITSACTTPNSWNNYLVVYQGAFDPSHPLNNVLAAVDGGYNDQIYLNYITQGAFTSVASLRLNLSANQTYTIVTTGTASSSAGAYVGTVTADPVAAAPVATFSGTLGGALLNSSNGYRQPFAKYDANSNLITPTQISATPIAFHADSFTVPTTGSYTITDAATVPAQWGLYLVLYQDVFDPSSPLSNVIVAVPSDNQKAVYTLNLTAGTTYYAVTGGFGSLAYGDYALSVQQAVTGATPLVYTDALNGGTRTTFTRPNVPAAPNTAPTALSTSNSAKNDFLDAQPFTVPTTGLYNIDAVSNPSGTDPFGKWDDLIVLYQGSFDPANPLLHAIAANDAIHLSGTSTDAGLRGITLTAGTQYTLVTAGSSFNQFGSYQATVYTGGGDYPPIIPDYVAASPTALSAIDANITDTFTVLGLNSVTINGLYHPHAGDLTATFSHTDATTNQTVTIELLDRIGRTSTSSTGTSAEAFGDFTFAPGGGDISAVAAAAVTAAASVGGTPLIDPTQSYAPFTNDTAGQSLTLTGNFALFNGMNVSGPWTLTIADRNAGSTGSFSGFSFNVAPTTGTLTGNIALEGVDDLSATNAAAPLGTFHIGLRAPGSLTEVRGYNVTLNTASGSASGSYSIPDVPTGTYDVWIKGSKNLAVLVPNVVISTAGATVSDVLLNGGDVDNDNTVGPTDFATFVSVYNSSAAIPGTGYDPAADFNFDGAVDPTDFNIFVGDYNTAGAI